MLHHARVRDPHWQCVCARGLAIRHAPQLAPELVVRAIEEHRAHDAAGREACEHWGPAASLSRVVLQHGGERLDLAVKLCRWRGLRGALSDRLRGSRAARALAGAARLPAEVPSPEPLASAERRCAGLVLESYLVTRFLPDATPLPAALPGLAATPRRRRAVVRAVGDLVGALHAAGIDHADFKHSNLLVGPGERVSLVDLDSLLPGRRPSWRRRVRALGQLEAYATDLYPWLPRTDRARFLRAYVARHPSLAERRRELVSDVRRWVERRLAEWSRRDRSHHIVFPLAPREPPRDATRSGSGERR